MEIRPLGEYSGDRSGFRCGNPSLDEFIHRLASQYEKRDLARTLVAIDDSNLLRGYYSISSSSVVLDALPDSARQRLPRHPVPVILLSRLAVDLSCRGERLGERLLMHCFRESIKIADKIGSHAITVQAMGEQACSFYRKYGFERLLDNPFHLFISLRQVRGAFR